MTKAQELHKKLEVLNSNYHCFCLGSSTVCLDGHYTKEELEIIIQLLDLYNNEKV